ncbi:MAG: nucleotide exchange factor GrpE [Phycisphaerae bacterium]|jgi:molecular chaperone GrpE|nr:nucleotide exchange factor GrpE [Phycisphaerae bacterium]
MTKKKKKKTEPNADDIIEAAEAQDIPTVGEPVEPTDPTAVLQTERDDLLARLQRTAADYSNYQKRVQREMTEARDFANVQLITQLLSVLDDMERALEAAGDGCDKDDPLLTGMQLVHDKALEVLGRFGMEIIEALGRPFDPESHSALMQQPSDEHPPQTVLQELQRGYKLKGRTIRPTAVIVSTEPSSDETEDAQETTDNEDQ